MSSPEIDRLREQAFEAALDDKDVEALVMAAEGAGAGLWLDSFVATRIASAFPSDQALALTAASFRPQTLSPMPSWGRTGAWAFWARRRGPASLDIVSPRTPSTGSAQRRRRTIPAIAGAIFSSPSLPRIGGKSCPKRI
ncbi:hypothetical protein ACRAWD_02615 [Caulobacter segnis]